MSRERILIRYALPALIIVSLVLYLGLRNRDRLLYDLPQLPEMAVAEVDRVEIVKGDRLVAVRKQGDGWLLEPDEFPAATAQVDTMVRALASLEITDLVSEHSAYSRFELDPRVGAAHHRLPAAAPCCAPWSSARRRAPTSTPTSRWRATRACTRRRATWATISRWSATCCATSWC